MYYIIANNGSFDISKVAERLNPGDTVMHLNGHSKWKRLHSHPIYSECSHEIFFNFKMWGIGPYRKRALHFSKVYWATYKAGLTVPKAFRNKRVSQLLKKEDLRAALISYFNKGHKEVMPVVYKSKTERSWSVGHKALRHLLKSVKPNCVKLAGFSFNGWAGHPWKAEEKFAYEHEIELI